MRTIEFHITNKGIEAETVAGTGDAFGMGNSSYLGHFDSMLAVVRKLQEARRRDGHSWHSKAKIQSENGEIIFPLSSRSYIVENGFIFDDEGNLYDAEVLTKADSIYFCIYR